MPILPCNNMEEWIVDEAKSFFQGIDFDTNSSINATKIHYLIAQWLAYIEGSLHGVYSSITNENDMQIIRSICARFVAGDIDDILNATAVDGTRKTRDLKKEAKEMLNELRNRLLTLSGGPASRITSITNDTRKKEF